MELNLWVAFIAGLASFLSPCVLPLVPAYISYMGGRASHTAAAQSLSTAAGTSSSLVKRISTFLHGVAFVAGFTLVFAGIGLLSTAFIRQIGGQNVGLVKDIITRVGGLVIIFFGLHFTGLLNRFFQFLQARPKLLSNPLLTLVFGVIATGLILWAFVDILVALPVLGVFWVWLFISNALIAPQPFWTRLIATFQNALYADTRRQMTAEGKQGYASSVIMGVVFAAGWTPCIGPIYGSILTMAAAGAEVGRAGSLMIAYSLGLGIPFLLAALLLDQATTIMRRLTRYVHTFEMVAGALLLVVGIMVATGQLQTISQSLNGQFADFSYQLEDCAAQVSSGELPLGEFFSCLNTPDTGTPAVSSSS
ncbi:MAG: cytochrome c biogenesis protein CcdA [Anaerolineae bacterium]